MLKEHFAYVLRWNRGKNILLLFTYLITLGKDLTFALITKFKTNKVSELSICKLNTELNCGLTD